MTIKVYVVGQAGTGIGIITTMLGMLLRKLGFIVEVNEPDTLPANVIDRASSRMAERGTKIEVYPVRQRGPVHKGVKR